MRQGAHSTRPEADLAGDGQHGTAHERIYESLKAALMNGAFWPGERLVVRDLAERFSTSPMPVREALRRLVSEQALSNHPNRGVIVPPATVESIADLQRVRCSIEGAATEWAAATITAAEIKKLKSLNDRMLACTRQRDPSDYLALNTEFHFTIYKAARSGILIPIIEGLWLQAGPRLNIMRGEATIGMGMDHHQEIVAALLEGDGARARRALVRDISDAADIMLRAAAADGGQISMERPRVGRKPASGRKVAAAERPRLRKAQR
ncbi:GntR family transcriptional regulator [Dongia deserti]|uniref:GntR family transcriptional regulator n=1 Tax=Dongia deserti TaxID=2268030 RepID=UPI000E64F198|nr:GntR family transcriptional regulator [Dongia deserti]